MKISHYDGSVSDTDKMNDVDALLVEKMKELHELHVKYGKQVVILSASGGKYGSCHFHMIDEDKKHTEEAKNAFDSFMNRLDWFVLTFTGKRFSIAPMPE